MRIPPSCRSSRESAAVLIPLLLAMTGSVGGCASPEPTYDGPRLSADAVAILRAGGLSRVLRLDDRDLSGKALELLPGKHDLHVKFEARLSDLDERYESTGETMRAYCDVHFFAKAGHHYRLGMTFNPDMGWGTIPSKPVKYFAFYMYLVDETDQRVLEDAVDERGCHLPRDRNS
jgi:hypothetical protein